MKFRTYSIGGMLAFTIVALNIWLWKTKQQIDTWRTAFDSATYWSEAWNVRIPPKTFLFDVAGKTYGISTCEMKFNGQAWEPTDKPLASGWYAFPPGKHVSSISQAFDLFKAN